jgi:FtsH-binding integral membrane protein
MSFNNTSITNITTISNKKIAKTNFSQLFKLLYVKKFFFMLILINLLIQVAITYYVHINFNRVELTKDDKVRRLLIIGAHILSFVFIIILDIVPMPNWLKFILFSLFSVTMGIILEDIKPYVDEDIIRTAFICSISIFVLLFAFAIALIGSAIQLPYKISLSLFFALLVLLICSIIQYFIYLSSILKKTLLGFTLLLFSVYVVYATNIIAQRDYSGDFITASMDYYLELFNIFVALLYNISMKLFYSIKNVVKKDVSK